MDAVAMCWRRGIDSMVVASEVVRDPTQLDAVAAVAADRDVPLAVRLIATSALVEAAAIGDLRVPDLLAEAIDDLALVDAAVSNGRAGAVCAALLYLGARDELASTRRRVVRRLVAAGVSGLPIAGLALSIGDLAAGALLAQRDFLAHVAPRARHRAPDPDVAAWARWLAALPDAAARAVIDAVGDRIASLMPHAGAREHARISSMVDGP